MAQRKLLSTTSTSAAAVCLDRTEPEKEGEEMSTKRSSGRPNEGELFIGLKTTTTKYLSCRVRGHGLKLNKLVQAQRNLFVLCSATELGSSPTRNNNNSSSSTAN